MNTLELFKLQLQDGATAFFYAIEKPNLSIVIQTHRDSLDTFPKNLTYIRDIGSTNRIPLFKENK